VAGPSAFCAERPAFSSARLPSSTQWPERPGVFAPPTGSWPPICREMAQGLWANGADGHICGRNRGRSGSTYGSPGAGAPAPVPVPASAQRLPKFLSQPAASQHVWLIPPTLGRSLARIERASGRRQAEKPLKIGLYSPAGRSKNGPDEEKPLIRGAGRLDNTPKWDVIQTCLITC
jgi:hypothetical protein